MKRKFLMFLTLMLALHIAVCNAAAADVVRMEQVAQDYVKNNQFMGSILVVKNGHITFDKAYGYANVEWLIPNTAETKFRLGSLTKQFTAASILLLEERGKLKTSDLVSKYIPDAPKTWDKITIYNLLTHTSGIPNYTEFPDYDSSKTTAAKPEALIARFKNKPLDFQPGEKWKYSNSGYALLGYLIEKISGQSYKDFVQKNIFKPLKMNDSGYDSHSVIIFHRAYGYSPSPTGLVNADYIDMSIPFSAGALYSTTHDLLKWEQGLFSGKLLTAASLKKMTTPFKHNYALGLWVEPVNGHTAIEHDGGVDGFNTHLAYFPDDKLIIVVLGNQMSRAPGDIAAQLAAVVHGEKIVLPSERKAIVVAQDILANYIGTYELAPGFSIVITIEGNQLIAQATNQPKTPLFAESETKFFLKTENMQLEFFKNDIGKVSHFVLHQGGEEKIGKRK